MKDLLSCAWKKKKKKQVKSSLLKSSYKHSDLKDENMKTLIFMLPYSAFCLLDDASEEENKRLTAADTCVKYRSNVITW